MKRTLKPREDLPLRLVISNRKNHHIIQSIRLVVNAWDKHDIDTFLFRLRGKNKGLSWRYEKLP